VKAIDPAGAFGAIRWAGGSLDVEQLDDRIRKAREIMQRCNDAWSLYETPLVECHINGKFDLVIRRLNVDPGEYAVVLKASPLLGGGEFESAGSAIRPKSRESAAKAAW